MSQGQKKSKRVQTLVPELITGLELRIWLKQGKEKRLLARILKFLEKARKRLSRQTSTIKVRKCEEKKT